MTLALIVWLVMTVLPAMIAAKSTVLGIGGVTLFVCSLIWLVSEGEYDTPIKIWLKQLKWSLPLLIVLSIVPDSKTAWYMVGAYTAETVVTSEVAGELGGAAKDMMLELMKKAKQEIGEVDGEAVKDAAKAAIQEVSK